MTAQRDETGAVQPDFRPVLLEALRVRLLAVSQACDLAESEVRHVVDDEVYVSVGLIRNALNTPLRSRTSPGSADGGEQP